MQPVLMIDGRHAAVKHIPVTTPKVAGYDTGTPDIDWTPSDRARFPDSGIVMIDQSAGPGNLAADVKDIELGAATIEDGITWARHRQQLTPPPYSVLYVSESRLAQVKLAVTAAALRTNLIGYGLANWDLDEAQAAARLGNEIVWVQWASPTSNPRTIVPGSDPPVTLAQADLDLGVTVPWWHPGWTARLRALSGQFTAMAGRLEHLVDQHVG